MAAGYGMKGHLMMARQSSFGTANTSSLEAIPIVSETLNFSIEQLQEQGMYSRFTESPYKNGAHLAQGDVNIEAGYYNIGYLARSVIGSEAISSFSNGTTHHFFLSDADFDDRSALDPFTVEVHYGVGSASQFYDMVGDSMSINFAANQLLTANASFIGGGFSRKAAGSPVYEADEGPYCFNNTAVSLGGASVIDLKDLNLNISNNLEAVYTLNGSKWPYRIKRSGQQALEMDGTLVFAAHSYWQQWEAGTQVLLDIETNVTSSGDNSRMNIQVPQFRFKTFNVNVAGPGLVEATFTAQGLLDVASNYIMDIKLQNSRSTLY